MRVFLLLLIHTTFTSKYDENNLMLVSKQKNIDKTSLSIKMKKSVLYTIIQKEGRRT